MLRAPSHIAVMRTLVAVRSARMLMRVFTNVVKENKLTGTALPLTQSAISAWRPALKSTLDNGEEQLH